MLVSQPRYRLLPADRMIRFEHRSKQGRVGRYGWYPRSPTATDCSAPLDYVKCITVKKTSARPSKAKEIQRRTSAPAANPLCGSVTRLCPE